VRKILIIKAIKDINRLDVVCPSVKSALVTLYLLLDMGLTHVSIEEE